ncbi:MAG: DUF4474 domain-containing protein [Clostridiaceae bacterium]|nr:DUF4474 domain-containing protein [Clostridiaceae bacterium]
MKKLLLGLVSFLVIFSIVFCNIFATHAVNPTGDVNSDGNVNSTDALIVLQYSVGESNSVKDFRAGDMNSDMLLNSIDALIILQISVGIINPDDYYSSTKGSSILNTTVITTTTKTTTTTTKVTTTQATPSSVYNSLAYQRKFGDNKYYDISASLVNCYLQTIRAYFTYNQKDWLIELWKGEYAMSTVGCEVGFYYREHNQSLLDTLGADYLLYKSVEDEDAMPVSMKLWQYVKATDETPVMKIDYSKRNCWWAADFETGLLEKHRDQTTLVMVATIDFPTTKMRDLFTEQLDNKGFREGTIDGYNNFDRYSVDGRTVTLCWRWFNED